TWSQYRSIYNKANDYQLDSDAQRTVRYSGLPGVWPQDSACQESMGWICDRAAEHLGSSDAGIIRARRRLMNAARALREQAAEPPDERRARRRHRPNQQRRRWRIPRRWPSRKMPTGKRWSTTPGRRATC